MAKKPPPKKAPPKRKYKKAKKSRLGLWTGFGLLLLIGAYLGVLAQSQPNVGGRELRVDTFVDLAERGRLENARILDVDSFVVGTYEVDGRKIAYNAPYLKETRQRLLDVLLENRVPTTIDQQNGKRTAQLASVLLPALIIAVLFVYMIISYRRGTGLFGMKSGARKTEAGGPSDVTFADVAGQDAAVTELKEIRDFLSDTERFAGLGAVVPKGVLLYGPPGCGKTLLARAVAGEAGANFYSISGSDFVEIYVGVGAARVRDLFREARENAPAIIFIDELDSVGRRRGGGGVAASGSGQEQEQALNQILAEMDGFSPLEGIIVMGATNRPDILDPALLRPGRFDRTIGLERPDEEGRLAVLQVHARNKPMDPAADLRRVANKAIGLSGADLASVMNEGALLAARAGRASITQVELNAALARIIEAPERQRRLSMRDRSFGRSTGGGGEDRVTFADVAGLDEAMEELAEVRHYLAEPERFVKMGARPPRGFLLVGPPGCGKTLLAKAVAVEANAAFFAVAATEFVEVFVGEGAGRVRDLFAEAKAAAPAIVFLDEIDAIGARRGASADGGREREQTLNQILVELDGFDARSGVTIMAASNRPEILDEALVRPGRFDRTVVISLPDRGSRRKILDVHAKGKLLGADVDLDFLARITQSFSGADLANVMNEGALLAARANLDYVPMRLLEEAVERVGVGIARNQQLTDEDRAMVAYHEVGHALVGRALPGAPTPHKLSIVSRGRSLGATRTVDEVGRAVHSRTALLDQMAGMLGGRAAEELVFGEPGSGAADDLQRVGQLARMMVCELGMSSVLGPLSYNGNGNAHQYSDDVSRTIDVEVRGLVDEAYGRAHAVLAGSRDVLDRAATTLLDQETLTAEELDDIAGPVRPLPRQRARAAAPSPARRPSRAATRT
ncbi:MAG TPA: AAA family ATPase [Acidimicrobiales bacterium]|nr:AAA family ATPase [Acidimicrobiales bacterium]